MLCTGGKVTIVKAAIFICVNDTEFIISDNI